MILFGLIGKTLSHSFSRAYFTKKFEKLGLVDHSYENFELQSIDEIKSVIKNHPDLKGLNVTVPYKEDVIPYLSALDPIVKETNACNCIKINNGQLFGSNTDVFGFRSSLQKHLNTDHTKALVLGTGGASKAVQYSLQQMHILFKVVSRKKQHNLLVYDDLTKEIIQEHKIIINTTPLGMYPHTDTSPSIPYQFLNKEHLLFDLIYNPEKTVFLKRGEERGATIINGYEMLVLQAEESWRIWNS
jgi:shikimate dehydrogenase